MNETDFISISAEDKSEFGFTFLCKLKFFTFPFSIILSFVEYSCNFRT